MSNRQKRWGAAESKSVREWKPQWDDTGGFYWSRPDWAPDCLIWFIDHAHRQSEWPEWAESRWSPQALGLHLTGRLVVVHSEDEPATWHVRQWMSVRQPGDARGIAKPEPEPLTGGLRKLQCRSRSADFLSAFSGVALWLSVAGSGDRVHVWATGNIKIGVCAESCVHVPRPILLISHSSPCLPVPSSLTCTCPHMSTSGRGSMCLFCP